MARTLLVSVFIITKNAAMHLKPCLEALRDFDEVVVIDSDSTDGTQDIVRQAGRRLESFRWNGCYPKKKQWCLENVQAKHDWVMLLDADEIVTLKLVTAIEKVLNHPKKDAYFIDGKPVFCGTVLHFGRRNRKITLFKRWAVRFPSFADDPILGISEIEYHYQPKVTGRLGRIKPPLLHYCADSVEHWNEKHARYAQWQAWVETAGIDLSVSEKPMRRIMKKIFYAMPFRPMIIFVDSFVSKMGFFDGRAGFRYARARAEYYAQVAKLKRAIANKAKGSAV